MNIVVNGINDCAVSLNNGSFVTYYPFLHSLVTSVAAVNNRQLTAVVEIY